ncbi:glucosamine-6-phosphate isomerase 1 [Sesbania bispinosa]|nr:glucosamine-6-phosphate isomerase 1 [Sesbania bispinosa]
MSTRERLLHHCLQPASSHRATVLAHKRNHIIVCNQQAHTTIALQPVKENLVPPPFQHRVIVFVRSPPQARTYCCRLC